MATFLGIIFVIFLAWLAWKYVLPEKVKDVAIGCLVMIGLVLLILFQVVGAFYTCSDNSHYERDPYDDVRK